MTISDLTGHTNRMKILSAVLGAGIVFSALAIGLRPREEVTSVAVSELSLDPIYSTYEFGEGDSIVDIGIQPLWIPTNIIAETMRRDRLLREALADLGLEIRFHPFLKGADVNVYLESGDLECGIGGDMPALTIVANTDALVTSLLQYGLASIVARRHMLIEDLRGKEIGYAFGSNAYHGLLEDLSAAGLQETDVRLVSLDVDEMPDALDQGVIDAYSAWEPTPTISLTRFEDQVVIHRCLTSGYLYFSRSFSDQHEKTVRQIIASQLRTLTWLRERKENLRMAGRWAMQAEKAFSGRESVLSVDQYVKLATEDLVGISGTIAVPSRELDAGGRLNEEFEFLKELGKVSSEVDWKSVKNRFDSTLLDDISSNKQKYQLNTFDYTYTDEGDRHSGQ